MTTPSYVVLKLINGDEIVCTYAGEDDTHILVLFPMLVKASPKLAEGRVIEAISLAPYTHFAADDEYTFLKSHIIFVKPMSVRYHDIYKFAVEDFLAGLEPSGPTSVDELKDAIKQMSEIFGDQVEFEDNQDEQSDSIFIDTNNKSVH